MQKIIYILSIGLFLVGSLHAQTPITFEGNAQSVLNHAQVSATLTNHSLTRVSPIQPTIDENVLFIGDTAFKATKGYRSIVIPQNVVKIGKQVFAECSDLEVIYFKTPVPAPPECLATLGVKQLDSCTQITYKDVVYFANAVIKDTLFDGNSVGCDSIITVTLNVHSASESFDTVKRYIPNAFPFAYGDSNFNLSNDDVATYDRDVYFLNSLGCDSIVHLHITVLDTTTNPPDDPEDPQEIRAEIVVYLGQILALSNPDDLEELRTASYKWYFNNELLFGKTKNYIDVGNPIPAGTYKVVASWDGDFLERDSTFAQRPLNIQISPNPLYADEVLNISSKGKTVVRHEVYNLGGQKIATKLSGDAGNYKLHGFKSSGAYVLMLYFENGDVEVAKIMIK
jgi:hypothetical protein